MNIQPHEIIGALAALGVYPPARILVKRAVLANDITGLSGVTTIPWDTGDFDPLNPTRIYVPPGFSHALITGMAKVGGTGTAAGWILRNGINRPIGNNLGGSAATTDVSIVAQMWPVSGGDYFEMVVNRATGLMDILSNDFYTSFSLTLFP